MKDTLEENLHKMVGAGKLDLPTAHHDIATNWIAAYKKCFHKGNQLPALSDGVARGFPRMHSRKAYAAFFLFLISILMTILFSGFRRSLTA